VIVLTALGPTHLPDCLDSLAALDYPRDAVEVIVVDNASAEDPSAVVARRYPGARVVRNASNLGFCGGNNSGVRAASHEWLLFLNDDTRVSPGLLRALFAVAERRGAACVGGFTVSWDGRRVDYAGGGVNFEGRGFQHGVGSSDLDRWRKERSVAFANGAAMLIAREAYRQAGGFPDSYFAYYEDVALGWALWLLGHEVWFCPDAIVYHHHHGTSARTANAARQRLCERNALFTVLAQSSQIELGRRLAASLLLCAERAALAAGAGGQRADGLALVDDHRLGIAERFNPLLLVGHLRAELLRHGARRERGVVGSLREVGAKGLLASLRSISHVVRWGGPPPADQRVEGRETYEVAADWAAALAASAEWCRRSGDMEERRRELQAGRRRDDVDLARRFVENWLDAVPVEPARQAEYDRAHRGVVEVMLASGDRVSG
jgi:GT2 family glycosyltransferase